MNNLKYLIYIAIGGFVGTLLRYEIFNAIKSSPREFPVDTFIVNIAGATIVGFVATIILVITGSSAAIRPMVLIGFCGALTTESTMAVNIDKLVSYHRFFVATEFLVSMLILGFLAIVIGNIVAKAITGNLIRNNT